MRFFDDKKDILWRPELLDDSLNTSVHSSFATVNRARFFSRYIIIHSNKGYRRWKKEFCCELQEVLESLPKHDVLIVTEGLNAKVGSGNTGFKQYMGKPGLRTRNKNGERFLELCVESDMATGCTMFQHKDIHQPGTHHMELLSTRLIMSPSTGGEDLMCLMFVPSEEGTLEVNTI